MLNDMFVHYDYNLVEELKDIPHEWYVVGFNYPIQPMETELLARIAEERGAKFLMPYKNRGCHGNWKWAMNEVGLHDDDLWLALDPDERPQTGYFKACWEMFKEKPDGFYFGLTSPGLCEKEAQERNCGIEKSTNFEAYKLKVASAWPIGGFAAKWVKHAGGITAPTSHYGYIEQGMIEKCVPAGAHAYLIKGIYNNHHASPHPIVDKWKHAQASRQTNKDLSEWMKSNT
jgi:hypothetical protein